MRHGTRVALLTVCLGASVVMLLIERQKTKDIADEMADLDRRTTAEVSDLRQQLSDAVTKADNVDLALSQAREQLGRSDDRHRSDEATTTDATAKLQTEQGHAAALADKLADTERLAVAKAAELQQRLETEQARGAGLDRDLVDARQQLARTDDLQRSAEASVRDAEAASQTHAQQATALADKLAEAEHRSTAATNELRERLEAEHARALSLEHDLVEARLKIAQNAKGPDDVSRRDVVSSNIGSTTEVDHRPSAVQAPTPAVSHLTAEPPTQTSVPASDLARSAPSPQTDALPPSPPLPPADVPARIVLHYTLGSDSARAQAQFAELLLQEQGLHIEDHASPAKGVSASRVIFFYKEDQAIAKTIADTLARITGSDTLQKPLMSLKPLPRPGTIEVAISG